MKTLTKSSSISYIKRMRFKVEKLPVVQTEIQALEQSQQEMLRQDYELVETMGIEFVKIKPIQNKIFEIKTNEIRSLFKYAEGQIIIIGVVFVKKTQKTPKNIIKIAQNDYGRFEDGLCICKG